MDESRFQAVQFSVTLVASHGEQLILVCLDDEPSKFAPLDKDVINYQWIHNRFVRYDEVLPKTLDDCPAVDHDHKDGFVVVEYFSARQRKRNRLEVSCKECTAWFADPSEDHIYPPKCRARAIAAAIAEALKSGCSMEEITLEERLLRIPSSEKLVFFGPSNNPKYTVKPTYGVSISAKF